MQPSTADIISLNTPEYGNSKNRKPIIIPINPTAIHKTYLFNVNFSLNLTKKESLSVITVQKAFIINGIITKYKMQPIILITFITTAILFPVRIFCITIAVTPINKPITIMTHIIIDISLISITVFSLKDEFNPTLSCLIFTQEKKAKPINIINNKETAILNPMLSTYRKVANIIFAIE